MKTLYTLALSFIFILSATAQGSGCPQIDAGPDQLLPCNVSSTTLTATAFDVGETTSYGVTAIPHAPPIAYNAGGGTAVSVNTDDVWSGVINLPFPFCFFWQTYSSCIIGSNGAIGFDIAAASGYHPWPFSVSVPNPALAAGGNIFGPYHDIDPSVAGTVRYYLLGQAPCRTFIVSYNNLGHYDCTNLRSTHMMVLYETTNIIEVYVNQKQTCTGWNSGNTVIGIQNMGGTAGYTPPGRNTGPWSVTTPEAWQFKPTGATIYSTVQWYQGAVLQGTGNTITVNPLATTTYQARTTYTRCDGLQIPVSDNVTVQFEGVSVSVSPTSSFACSGATTTLTASSPTANSFTWMPGGLTGASINVSPTSTTTYTVTATNTVNGCSASASATINVAQPISTSCNVIYVTPTGTPSGNGTKANPYDLNTALEAGACNGTVIKMAVGDYVTDTAITKVTSYLTLEGGFDPALNWDKISTAGATRILRTATQTTSLATGSGITNETGLNPEVVAMTINNQTGFRFQDLTIATVNLGGGTTYSGYEGVDMVGLRLNNCNTYNLVRTQVLAGSASNGANQIFSIPATSGGNSRGLEITVNGANTNLINSIILAGAAGNGGTGGGANGIATNIVIAGTPFVTNDIAFSLSSQPVVRMEDKACTATDILFTAPSSNSWAFGIGSSPPTGSGINAITQYSNLGRKNIVFGSNIYTGFANIILDDQVNPEFTTTATLNQGVYRVCAGELVGFTATNGGLGYVYHWNLGGGADGNNAYDGSAFSSVSESFSTPGIYNITLNYETNCCGISSDSVLILHVEEQPVAVMPADQSYCLGDQGGVSLTVGGDTLGGSISWSPITGLSSTDTYSVVALPASTTTYTVMLEDSTGFCSSTNNVTVTVNDISLVMSSTPSSCSGPGTAAVTVSGGSGSYTYLWSNGGTTASISSLQPGSFTVVVTDQILSCQDSASVNVLPGLNALIGALSLQDVSCNGSANGSAIFQVSGGTLPYIYSWSHLAPGITTFNLSDTVSNLSPGAYMVNVTDNLGCEFELIFNILEPNSLNFGLDSLRLPTCHESGDGHIEVRVDGGVRPYIYAWTNGTPVVVVNDVVIAANLSIDQYTLVVTDSSGCVDSISFDLYVDSIVTNLNNTVCYGSQYTMPSGAVWTLTTDTFNRDTLSTALGCDSIILVDITVLPERVGTLDTVLCFGQSILINGNLYNTTVVNGQELIIDLNPCDSVLTINITVLDFTIENRDTTLCQGQSLTVNGINYNVSGSYNDTAFYAVSGCDSVQYVVNLQIDSFIITTLNTTLCQGQSVTVNGVNYTNSGIYNDTAYYAVSGCDSIQYVVNLQIDSFIITNIDTTLCQGQSLTVNGVTYTSNGAYNDTAYYAVSGCDSIQYVVNLQIDSFIITNIDTTLCQGQSLTVNGVTYTSNGAYNDTAFYAVSGCDSVQYLINLAIDSFIVETIDTTLCQGQSLTVNGVTYTSNGAYNDTAFYSVSGCDSVQYVVNVQIDSFIVETIDTTLCQGQSLTVNGVTYTSNGAYNDTAFYAVSGCDSIRYVINLAMDSFIVETIDTTLCQGQSLTVNGVNYSASGLYSDVAVYAVSGCDSVQFVIDLQIDSFTIVNIDTILCFGESIMVNGITYNSSGFYQDTLRHVLSGCDQVQYNVDLLILDEKIGLVDTAICQGESIFVNGTEYNSTAVGATEVFVVGPQGCDSTVTINLQIDPLPNLSALSNPDTIFVGGNAELLAIGTGTFEWDDNQTGPINIVSPLETSTYAVLLTDSNGCQSEFSVSVFVIGVGLEQIIIPDAFSPNGDNLNDIFRVVTDEYFVDIEMIIYNRWGEILHRENGTQNHGWDGRFNGEQQATESYIYIIRVVTPDGKEFFLSGNVALIR